MITNQKQYKVTQTHLKEFEAALGERKRGSAPDGIDEGMWQLEQDALESQIEDFKADLSAFENLQAGKIVETNLNSLADLPVLLIQARIAQGLTQKRICGEARGQRAVSSRSRCWLVMKVPACTGLYRL